MPRLHQYWNLVLRQKFISVNGFRFFSSKKLHQLLKWHKNTTAIAIVQWKHCIIPLNAFVVLTHVTVYYGKMFFMNMAFLIGQKVLFFQINMKKKCVNDKTKNRQSKMFPK